MTVTEEQIKEILTKAFPEKIEVTIKRQRRVDIKISRVDLTSVINYLSTNLNVQHLSTITARDTGNDFEILYHFFVSGILLTVHTTCPRNDPTVNSILKIFPSAVLYEREIHDLLGITPKGHPDLRPLVLPDNWKQGYPLRKDWKPSGGETND